MRLLFLAVSLALAVAVMYQLVGRNYSRWFPGAQQ
jgi:hypothetical protein